MFRLFCLWWLLLLLALRADAQNAHQQQILGILRTQDRKHKYRIVRTHCLVFVLRRDVVVVVGGCWYYVHASMRRSYNIRCFHVGCGRALD